MTPIDSLNQQWEHAMIYGTPPSTEPPAPRAKCCEQGGAIEWGGPITDYNGVRVGGWGICCYEDHIAADQILFCPWCGAKLPEKP